MKLSRVAVVGGGPGGLYAARLLKLAYPGARVEVYERGDPTEAIGFGVGLAAATQRHLEEADRATFDDIVARSRPHDMSMRIGEQLAVVSSDNLRAIGRATLNAVLQRHAREVGVELRFHATVRATELDADLVIAADGVSSATREALAGELGASVSTSRGLYLWCGADFALERALFSPAMTEHGPFVTHAYPYAADRSTFLVETDEETWRRAGFDRTTEATPEGASDEASLAWLERAFAPQLEGHRLIGNRTRWLRFRTVRCARWHHGRIVLLGDAAHTAHYSIGSGTKLAMEDGIALRDALLSAEDLETALRAYDAARRPAVERLQAVAQRSQRWWDSFPERLDLPVERLLVAYMTRAGKVSLERFAAQSPDVVRRALASYGGEPPPDMGDAVAWVLDRPLRSPGLALPSRTIDRARAGEFASVDGDLPATPGRGYWLGGPTDDREQLLARLERADEVKRRTGAVVVVEAPESLRSDVAGALVAGRADLVCWSGP